MSENSLRTLLDQEEVTISETAKTALTLSLPSILAQITSIMMQYIDAAMVGSLGAEASASIGLVSSSTWLVGGLLSAAAAGFSVQCAHAVGAGDNTRAKSLFRQGLTVTFLFSLCLSIFALLISGPYTRWLGAEENIVQGGCTYLRIQAAFLVSYQLLFYFEQMLQRAGDMKTPGILMALMCLEDVVFNFLLIFPTRTVKGFVIYGAGLGVAGASLGTALSILVTCILTAIACRKYFGSLRGTLHLEKEVMQEALRISVPMALEQAALSGAQIVQTKIVSPLGTIAIAANSFGVTAESLCYMPGYGIASAATTMVGQSMGAKRKDLMKRFAWISTWMGVAIMSAAAVIMYFLCPYVFAFLTPDKDVQSLGIEVLRIELYAEALFAASIVATGALRGAGDTLIPGILNLISMWCIRIPLAYMLSKSMGLHGVWAAMAVELCVRGILFLIRLARGKWIRV